MDQWRSKFSESFSLDRYWSIECSSLFWKSFCFSHSFLVKKAISPSPPENSFSHRGKLARKGLDSLFMRLGSSMSKKRETEPKQPTQIQRACASSLLKWFPIPARSKGKKSTPQNHPPQSGGRTVPNKRLLKVFKKAELTCLARIHHDPHSSQGYMKSSS